MWLGLETEFLQIIRKTRMGPVKGDWWCPYEKRKLGHMETMQGLRRFWKD